MIKVSPANDKHSHLPKILRNVNTWRLYTFYYDIVILNITNACCIFLCAACNGIIVLEPPSKKKSPLIKASAQDYIVYDYVCLDTKPSESCNHSAMVPGHYKKKLYSVEIITSVQHSDHWYCCVIRLFRHTCRAKKLI